MWVSQGVLTEPGKYAGLVEAVPADPVSVARTVQGLLIHEGWAPRYGVELTPEARDRVNLRRVEQVLDAVVGADDRPLTEEREPSRRIATNCRGFSVLAVSIFRAHGVPARARCGFGAYFTPGYFEDHWVAEFHDGERWRLLDAQLDDRQRDWLKIGFDRTDVPHDQFVIAGDAWQRTRRGAADPDRFGLTPLNEAGAWWIAANLMRDAAALNGLELLPWDLWGAMPEPADVVDDALFDELAAATEAPDMAAVQKLLADERLGVREEVFNVQHGRKETI